MQYFGGKQRISKEIVSFLQNYQNKHKYILEPFVGGCNIISEMNGKRFASDVNEYLIEMYIALQRGWYPPKSLTMTEYDYIKNNKNENKPLSGFVGIACSYAGKWFGGYAKNNSGRNYCLNGYNTILKLIPKIKDIKFKCVDYKEITPKNCLIYCDPPYQNATRYDIVGSFDHKQFWDYMRNWSEDNTVFISEYSSPEDFKCVWHKETKLDIQNKNGEKELRIEKLFTIK